MYSVELCSYPYFQLQIIVIHDGFLFLQLVLIRMGVGPMGGGERLVYRSTVLTVSQRWNVPEETCLWLSHDLRIFLYSVPSFSVKDYTSNISPKHIKMLKWREREGERDMR